MVDIKSPGLANVIAFLVLLLAVISVWVPGIREIYPWLLAALALAVILK